MPKHPSGSNALQWTHLMASVDASIMVIIIVILARNLNFEFF
jgi:hypothetical protein